MDERKAAIEKLLWLFQEDRYEDNYGKIRQIAEEAGYEDAYRERMLEVFASLILYFAVVPPEGEENEYNRWLRLHATLMAI